MLNTQNVVRNNTCQFPCRTVSLNLNAVACFHPSFFLSLFICTLFIVGWVPVVSALSVTAVDGGKEQEGLIDREKQRCVTGRFKS